ncbi:flagellar filament capping protein FliD [Haliovirga abyssi]|uniref:Flagellar hook-associated protein 2 n=1 Tax=Haliovirga abyssi TaxID=2996794 RepID=A0AAU9DM49_9FUSO|nr:flagellar filament capping protein FliD [Haliovirga abyssi]BDU51072.1 flagellar hook-associated protein 2 [Haliovirga abyssi]
MAGVQLAGMASGLDTSSIIQQMLEADRQPMYQKQKEINKIKMEKTIWQNIDSKMSSLKSAATNLKFSSTFDSRTVSSTDDSKITGTATTSASASSYVLENVVLAEPGKITSGTALNFTDGVKANVEETSTLTDPNEKFSVGGSVTEGSFKINGKVVDVIADDTINMVINKINVSNAGVVASFDSTTGKFKIEAKEASTSQNIEFDSTDTSGFLTAVGMETHLGEKIENGENPDYQKKITDVSNLSGVSNGFFTINGYTFEMNTADDSIESIINDINGSSAGVTAFYDNDTKKMTLTAKESGDDITLENDTSGFLASMNLMNQTDDTDATTEKSVYSGSDATVTINGVNFTKPSNKFNINGVNFELKSATDTGEKITLSVSQDTDKAYGEISGFVDKYNNLISYLEDKTKKDGELQGDSMAVNLIYSLRNKLTGTVSGLDSDYNQLALVGVEASDTKTSTLKIDKSKLTEALKANMEAVKGLFTQDIGTGTITDEAVGTGDGTTVDYSLNYTPSSIDKVTLQVGTTTYTASNSTNKLITSGTPQAGEIYVNLQSGELKFGTAPASGETITSTYDYDENNSRDGIAVRLKSYLNPYTIYNGTMDSHIKSLDSTVKDMNEWIDSMNSRLKMRSDSLKKQFTAMEQAISTSNSQSSWLTGQLASLGTS